MFFLPLVLVCDEPRCGWIALTIKLFQNYLDNYGQP